MRLAVLSDVHSNLEALEAVLAHADADRVVVLGDLVGYGADPDAVVRRLLECGAFLIAGNHDLAVTERFDVAWFNVVAAEAVEWTRANIEPDIYRSLAALEPKARHDGRLLVHGSVRDPAAEYLRDAYAAAASFEADPSFEIGLYGHTHLPAAYAGSGGSVRRLDCGEPIVLRGGERHLLNPGSVGQPRDGDPRASYLSLEDDVARWRRVPYDIAGAQGKIRAAGLPAILADRLDAGR